MIVGCTVTEIVSRLTRSLNAIVTSEAVVYILKNPRENNVEMKMTTMYKYQIVSQYRGYQHLSQFIDREVNHLV